MTRWLLYIALFCVCCSTLAEDVGDELLPPEEAFQLEAHVEDANTVVARWKIADGYFLYRDKFQFQIDAPGYRLGEFDVPPGKPKNDEFFGEVEIYRHEVNIGLPVTREADTPTTVELKATSQGCADLGVCYPPFTQIAALTFSRGGLTTQGASNPLAALTDLAKDLGGAQDDEFLPPDEAFRFAVEVQDANTLAATWRVAEGYYLYRDKMKFVLEGADGVALGAMELPAGTVKNDEFFGRVEIYPKDITVLIPVVRAAGAQTAFGLVAQYQGCAQAGICYPPITKVSQVQLPPGGPGDGQATSAAAPAQSTGSGEITGRAAPSASTTGFQSEQDRIAQSLASGSTWLTVISFFGFGLLLAFTPCVFPMIPILSGIIIGQGKSITAGRAFSLSLVYVLAMAMTYTIAGVLVGLSGENVQAWFQNPWVISGFAAVFVLLSLSMFGFYELQMPSAIQSRLTQISNSQQGGTVAGVAIMGFLSALIVGPCVTAPLIGALIYIADTGDAVLGGLALFALSMGMGAPLLLIGTSAGKLLPKAGAWMDATKAVFGVLLLGVGVWLLERILPIQAIMVLTGALLIVSAIYMGALESIREDVSGWFRLWKGVGLVMLIYGATLIIGAVGGGHSVLQPLRGVMMASGSGEPAHGLAFRRIKGVEGFKAALAQAQAQGRPVMLDFYADWCVSCKEMETFTFSDPAVQAVLKDAVLIQADVTGHDAQDRELLKHFGLFGPPAILFFTQDGMEQRPYRVVGFMPAVNFSQHIKQALDGAGTRA